MRTIVQRGVAAAVGATIGLTGVAVSTAGADEAAPSDLTIEIDIAPLSAPLRGIPLRGVPLRGVDITVSITSGTFKADVLTF